MTKYYYKRKGTKDEIGVSKATYEMMKKSQMRHSFHFSTKEAVDPKPPKVKNTPKKEQK